MTTDAGTGGHVTLPDLVNAASDVLNDIEHGRLREADVDARTVEALKELFGTVGSGPDDPLWDLHGDTTRQYLERGGVSLTEAREWVAVLERRQSSSQ